MSAHVYLLHTTPALHHARHYCGHTPNGVSARVEQHRKGTGAHLTRAMVKAGCTLHVAKTWAFDDTHEARLFERALKDSHRLPDYCPMCMKGRTRQPATT